MILYSVASPPLTQPTYPFSNYVTCIAGCIVRCHFEAILNTLLPMPKIDKWSSDVPDSTDESFVTCGTFCSDLRRPQTDLPPRITLFCRTSEVPGQSSQLPLDVRPFCLILPLPSFCLMNSWRKFLYGEPVIKVAAVFLRPRIDWFFLGCRTGEMSYGLTWFWVPWRGNTRDNRTHYTISQ